MSVKASNIIATLFILVGLVIVGFGLYPTVTKWAVLTGVAVAVFGALMYPSGGAGPAFQQVIIAVGSLPIFGSRAVGSIPAVSPPEEKKQ